MYVIPQDQPNYRHRPREVSGFGRRVIGEQGKLDDLVLESQLLLFAEIVWESFKRKRAV
jgi:hypothetical protein